MRGAIELMKRREEEILNTLTTISKRTNEFMNPELMVIGGCALRAYISLEIHKRLRLRINEEEWLEYR
jgi:hypothetical protein